MSVLIKHVANQRRTSRVLRRLRTFVPSGLIYRGFLVPLAARMIVKDARAAVARYGSVLLRQGISPAEQFAMVLRTCLTNPGLWGEEYYLYRLHRRENESFKNWLQTRVRFSC